MPQIINVDTMAKFIESVSALSPTVGDWMQAERDEEELDVCPECGSELTLGRCRAQCGRWERE